MDTRTRGMVYMLLSTFGFAMMQIFVALTAGNIPLFEQSFFSNLCLFIFACQQVHKHKVCKWGHKNSRKIIVFRAIAGCLATHTTYYATARTMQGDYAIISRITPFVITLIAFFFLKETITKWQIIALIVATIGVISVSNPSFNSDLFPIIVAIASAILSGIAHSCVAMLRGKEHAATILYFFSLFATVVNGVIMIPTFVMPTFFELCLLVGIGLSAICGLQFLTLSYLSADAGEMSIYSYSGIVMSMGLGAIFLKQSVAPTSIIGGLLVTAAAMLVYYGNKHAQIQQK